MEFVKIVSVLLGVKPGFEVGRTRFCLSVFRLERMKRKSDGTGKKYMVEI